MSIQHMQMIFDAGELTGSEKATLLAYCNHTDAHGYTWAGVVRVADMTGFSQRTVKTVRKSLIERGLLLTTTRVARSGRRRTNITRVNLNKLESMKMPPREYDDNVIEELLFEEEKTSDQPKCTDCTGPDQPKCSSCTDPGKQLPLQEGAKSAPYPSEEPSGEPSSSSVAVEGIAHEATPPAEKKTKTVEPEDIVIERLANEQCTPGEATAVVDYIEQQGTGTGKPIRNILTWVKGRTIRDLRRDLAHVRRHSAAPTVTHCGIHTSEMKPYGCDACAGEIKGANTEERTPFVTHLELVGEKARPDLARLLGAPQTPAQASTGGWSWENQIRGERRHRNNVVGGTRHGIEDQATYDAMAQMTQDELRALMLG